MGKANTHELWKWSLTQYSKFNSDDSLLLVCGVQIPDDSQYFPDTHYGRGAIFTVPGKSVILVPESLRNPIYLVITKKGGCSHSHRDVPQVAQRNLSIVAHTWY